MLQAIHQVVKSISLAGNLYSMMHHAHSLLIHLGFLTPQRNHVHKPKKPIPKKPKRLHPQEKQLRNIRCCNDVSFILIGAYSAYLNTTSQPFYPLNVVATGLSMYDLYERYLKQDKAPPKHPRSMPPLGK